MKGLVVTTENEVLVKEFDQPLNESIGEVVGGYIEIVHPRGLAYPFTMIVNEEGLMQDLPLNLVGSYLYEAHKHGHPIVGNIVIMAEGMTPSGYDITGLPDDAIESLKNQISQILGGKR